MRINVSSKRIYSVETSTNGVIENFRIDFSEIIEKNSITEVVYAIQDIFDDVMDLKVKEAMYFQPNRDDSRSKGIITRMR